jgi:hypothetical protein
MVGGLLTVVVTEAAGGEHHAGGPGKTVQLQVPAHSTPLAVKYCLLQHLRLPLSTTVHLSDAAGKPLDATGDNNKARRWDQFNRVCAELLPRGPLLTLDTIALHTAVATHVLLDSTADPSALPPTAQNGLVLTVHDTQPHVGQGAFGVVFRGTVTIGAVRRSVAVKRFHFLIQPPLFEVRNTAAVRSCVETFLLPEVNALLGLSHPNVVHLSAIGLGSVHGVQVPAFVAMDYCAEGTLDRWINDGRLDDDALLAGFLADFTAGIHYLHKQHVVHRDIKPDNLFVHSQHWYEPVDGRPFLVVGDVGLAKEVALSRDNVSDAGALGYRAPEALLRDHRLCSLASDMYSVAVTAVEMATKLSVHSQCSILEWPSEARGALVERARARIVSALSLQRQEQQPIVLTPAAVGLLLSACTISDPKERPTMREVHQLCCVHDGGQQEDYTA